MYDIIGDIHSCFYEFIDLLEKLGYEYRNNIFIPPKGRQLVLVGDVIDRGLYPSFVFILIEKMKQQGYLIMIKGNHDDKLQRYSKGNKVQLLHGLDYTIKNMEESKIEKERIFKFFNSIPYFLILDDGKLIIVHAAWKDSYISRDPFSRKKNYYCLFGPTTGNMVDGLPERIDWAINREIDKLSPIIVHGHQPLEEVREINKVWDIDTGCVFGNKLTALKYPEMEIVQVYAKYNYSGRK